MSVPAIDAEFKSEERYAKISLAYSTEEQYKQINDALDQIHCEYDLERNIYETDVSNGRKVIVIEYHDDYDRESGAILEKLIKSLGITNCVC